MYSFNLNDRFEHVFHIDAEVYEGFICIFKDNNPLHVDEVFAYERGFKGRVMHGNILNGFLSFFIGECLPTKNVIIHSQEIQFKKPVYLNDKLVFEAKISGLSEAVRVVELTFTFKNQDLIVVSKGKIQIGILQ